VETQLQRQAQKVGLQPEEYVVNTLREHLREQQSQPSVLSPVEAELLQKINSGLSQVDWQRYHTLTDKRRDETLTAEEQSELIALSNQIEVANAERIEHLVALAKLRQTSLETVMVDLGIQSPTYD
jgi:hypothetical protein